MPVLQTALNLKGMIQACREMNLPNPATAADDKNLTGLKHMVATLDAIQDTPFLSVNLLQLGYMVAAYPHPMKQILAFTGGMPHVFHGGVMQGVECCIISGCVNQWMVACKLASCPDAGLDVRFVYNRIWRDMESKLPRELMTASRRDNDDGTFLLLEDHR